MQEFRIFVSSPGDVAVERRRVDDVVSRLNGEFLGQARFVAVRWETGFYRAHETYQTQIPPASECDIVVGILKWRLGTPLPPDFDETLPGGESYPSGTAYEILTAMEKRRAGAELPDVFVFRYTASAPQLVLGDPNEDLVRREWDALCRFIARWFETPTGQFLAAFNPYASQDDFETQLELLLRAWCTEKVSGGRSLPWPAARGSPFRGLEVFDAAHAPVFFGRRDDTARAIDALRAAAGRGTPFLLLVGASGAGKSSLARAGLVPRLTTAGVIADVDAWRIAVMRPGDVPDDPVAALAAALVHEPKDLPATDRHSGAAVPEILEGDFPTAHALAAALNALDENAAQPILRGLERVAERLRTHNLTERRLRCDLLLVIDQLEEMFAVSVPDHQRARFASLLALFASCGRVWVIATLRADFYSRLIEEPSLKGLKDRGASCDLAAPSAVQMADIVRGSAAAAGLDFERDTASGERLDERLLLEADRPDMLPLVQLALTRLWEARTERDGRTVLPWQAYESMGGLRGIIEEAGERVLQRLGATERDGLAPLLHRLAEQTHASAMATSVFTARSAPLSVAAPDPSSRRLVDALVEARLLTISGDGEAAQLRLAHQRVLSDWSRAREIVARDAEFLRIRDETDNQRRRWETSGRRAELLLARGLPLAEAESIMNRHGDELPRETLAFVQASRRRADRSKLIGWAAAALFAIVAIAAAWQWRVAAQQTTLAKRGFAAAKGAVDGLIFDVAQGLRDVAGMRIDTTHKILDTVKGTVDRLIATAPADPGLERSRATMLNNFVVTYLRAGDTKAALAAATESLKIFRKLAAAAPDDLDARRDVGVSLVQLGDAKLRSGDQAGALAAFAENVAIDRQYLARHPEERRAKDDLIVSLDRIGDLKFQMADQAAAQQAFREALDIARALVARQPSDREARRDVSLQLDRIGDLELDASRLSEALAVFEESLAIRRKLLAEDPGDARRLRDVSLSLERVGRTKLLANDSAGTAAAQEEQLTIRRRLVAQDSGDADARRDLVVALTLRGDTRILSGDIDGALSGYLEALPMARALAAADATSARGRREVGVLLMKIGNTQFLAGKSADGQRSIDESLAIARDLLRQNPDSSDAQSDLAQATAALVDGKLLAQDAKAALPLAIEAVAMARRLAERQRSMASRRLIGLYLLKLGQARQQSGDRPGALTAFQEALDIARANAAQNGIDRRNQLDLAATLMAIAGVDPNSKDRLPELVAVLEKLDAAGALPQSAREMLTNLRAEISRRK